MKTFNQTPWTEEEIEGFPRILTIQNNWRGRMVYLYEHPTDPNSVVSRGVWFDSSNQNYCIEKRQDFAFELSQGLKYVTTN